MTDDVPDHTEDFLDNAIRRDLGKLERLMEALRLNGATLRDSPEFVGLSEDDRAALSSLLNEIAEEAHDDFQHVIKNRMRTAKILDLIKKRHRNR